MTRSSRSDTSPRDEESFLHEAGEEAELGLAMAFERFRLAFWPAFDDVALHAHSGSEKLDIIEMERALAHPAHLDEAIAAWQRTLETETGRRHAPEGGALDAASGDFTRAVGAYRQAPADQREARRAEVEAAWHRLADLVGRTENNGPA